MMLPNDAQNSRNDHLNHIIGMIRSTKKRKKCNAIIQNEAYIWKFIVVCKKSLLAVAYSMANTIKICYNIFLTKPYIYKHI